MKEVGFQHGADLLVRRPEDEPWVQGGVSREEARGGAGGGQREILLGM